MKKLIILFLLSCVSFLYAQDYTMYRGSVGYIIGQNNLDVKSPLSIGVNIGVKNEMDIYLVDVGLPLFDISYLNLGYGKYITENIYVAALFGIGTSNNTRKIYPNGGFEVGFNINNINISTSYTMMNTQSSLISLKIGFTSYK